MWSFYHRYSSGVLDPSPSETGRTLPPPPRGGVLTPLPLTVNSSSVIDLSVYMTSFSEVRGLVSFNLDARNIHTAPSSWSLVRGISTTVRNLSM